MSDDLGQDTVPVRDAPDVSRRQEFKNFKEGIVQERRIVSRLSREELEDRFLRFCEENLLLKRHARKQEDKIKKMATKLIRLINDHKKQESGGGIQGKKRDIETEELIEEMQEKIHELDRQNTQLKEKLVATKQQLAVHTKHFAPCSHVHCQSHSRLNPGNPKQIPARLQEIIQQQQQEAEQIEANPFDRYKETHNAPEDSNYYTKSMNQQGIRSFNPITGLKFSNQNKPSKPWDKHLENHTSEEVISILREQLDVFDNEIEVLREQLQKNQNEHEEELLSLKAHMNQNQRQNVQENVELIKLQREMKQAQDTSTALLQQYSKLKETYHSLKITHAHLLKEIENLTYQLKEEQNRVLSLQNELKLGVASNLQIAELKQEIEAFRKENLLLKQTNDKLMNSAFDIEKDKYYLNNENALKLQINQLEVTVKADLEEKNQLIQNLAKQKAETEYLEEESRKLNLSFYQLKAENEELKEKVNFFTKETAVDVFELQEALSIVHKRKEEKETGQDIIQQSEQKELSSLQQQLKELQTDHAETVNELERTRNMLQLQYKINADYQQEVELMTNKLTQVEKEHNIKIKEYVQMLDLREAWVHRLEKQIKDIAYGTKPVKLTPFPSDDFLASDLHVDLEKGKNIVEIHIDKIELTQEGSKSLNDDSNAALFLTWCFYDFEMQSTSVLRGRKLDFNRTAHYEVMMDEVFLYYLYKESMVIELHQAIGTEYKTLASGNVRFNELVERSPSTTANRFHACIPLAGVKEGETTIIFCKLDFWIRLKISAITAFQMFKEKSKAVGYIKSNENLEKDPLNSQSAEDQEHYNELNIKIIQCSGLQSSSKDAQPSPYCMYKFYNWPDHDTVIIPSSTNPQFQDHKIFQIIMDKDIDSYLKSEQLNIYVFDDFSSENNGFIGMAVVPLLPLAHNKSIKGSFELSKVDNTSKSYIEISIYWKNPYKVAPKYPQPVFQLNPRMSAGEETSLSKTEILAGSPNIIPTPLPRKIKTVEENNKSKADNLQNYNNLILSSSPITSLDKKPPVVPRAKLLSKTQELVAVNKSPEKLSKPSNGEVEVSKHSTNYTESKIPEIVISKIKQISQGSPAVIEEGTENSEENFDSDTNSIEEPKVEDKINQEGPSFSSSSSMSSSSGSSADNDNGDVVTPKKEIPQKSKDLIVIEICHLRFNSEAAFLNDPNIQMLFVEYRFLGYPPEELETPFALPKPKAAQKLLFNFHKVFHIDAEKNSNKRQLLAQMINQSSPTKARITFTVVSEPPEDRQDIDCEDVGFAYVDLKQILKYKKNIINEDVNLYAMAKPNTIIGSLNLTIEALTALQEVSKEFA